MMKRMFKAVVPILILIGIFYFFVGTPEPAQNIAWGVHFSQKQAERFGLDWREVYLSLLDDLGVSDLRLSAYWDLTEPQDGRYNFVDLDWQLEEAEKRGVNVLLIAGLKLPRWPECHAPDWANELAPDGRREKLLEWLEAVILRYKDSRAIWAWQVENEPLFRFGECPKTDREFLKREIELVRSLDSRPIVVTDSGEWSFWFTIAKIADIPGATMYKRVWFSFRETGFYVLYPLPSRFYRAKADLVEKIFGKEVIITELQAEPWGPVLLYELPLEEQGRTMDLEKLENMIDFARKSGFSRFYFWGSEWWYWMKTVQNEPEIWDEIKRTVKVLD